ncbi:MAG: hypothetical protein AB9873_07530 [Syntrophobacteraceae bacterium]
MRRPTASFNAISCLLLVLSLAPYALAAGKEKVVRTQGQMDAKIIHVDKWGVYVPNIVFYWDTELGKQKQAALTATAERLRNKLATIVYTTQSEIGKDKRPLIVEITPISEQTTIPGLDQKPGYDPGGPAGFGEGPKVYPSDPSQGASEYDARTDIDATDSTAATDTSSLALSDHAGTDPIPLVRDKPLEAPPSTMVINKREVQMLVEHILHLTEKKSLESLLYYYGDQVNYYGRGDVTKEYIRKDMGYYFKNWDSIACSLVSDVIVVDTDRSDTKILRFTSRYAVENSRKSLSGQTDNTWKVRKTPTGLKVIDQKQSIIRSEPQ